MAEFISSTHLPGKDGVVFGVAPDASTLYGWQRILAGGGTSEFSAVRMRGPLTLSSGQTVPVGRVTQTDTGSTPTYVMTGLGNFFSITMNSGNGFLRETGGMLRQILSRVGAVNTTLSTIPWVLFDVTLCLTRSLTSVEGDVRLNFKRGSDIVVNIPQSSEVTMFGVDPAVNTVILSGRCLFPNWTPADTIEVYLSGDNDVKFTVSSLSYDVQAL